MLTVRGLGNRVKRREVFNWLRDKKFSIIMLQKVHCINKNIPIYLAEWGYQGLFSCHTSASANNNINLQIQKTLCDPEGRFIEQFCITLTNTVPPKCKLTLDSPFSRESRIESRVSILDSILDTRFWQKLSTSGTFPIMQTRSI